VVQSFREHKAEIKRQLGEKLRHHLRRIPEIEFFRDESLDNAYRIEEVFKKINDEKAVFEKELADKVALAEKAANARTPKKAATKKAPAKKAAVSKKAK